MKKATVVTLVLLSGLSVCSLTGCGGVMLIKDATPNQATNSGCGTADFANESKRQAQEDGTVQDDSKDSKSSLEEDTSDLSVDDYVKSSDVDSTGVTIQSQSMDDSDQQSTDDSDQISTLPMTDEQKPVAD